MTESAGYIELWIMSLEKRVMHLGERHGALTERVEAMERRTHGPTSSTTSWVERVLSIAPTVQQLIIWLIPRVIIGWGAIEGWLAAARHFFGI